MSTEIHERFFGAAQAFDHPVTLVLTLVVAAMLLITPAAIWLLALWGRIDPKSRSELMRRYWSWLVLAPLILVPILLGSAWTILAVGVLSLFCYREYARATGLFREKAISLAVVFGILAVMFMALDNWYRFFVALVPFMIAIIAMTAILRDQPRGYIQRVALAILAFALFGSCLGHLGYLANDHNYRPILIWLFLCVEMNDIFAFIVGKTLGKRKLAPNTSPNKTVAGAVGAVVLTTLLAMGVGSFVFEGTVLESPYHLMVLGVIISVTGQFGDLMLSSIKRDLGIKDMAATIPGHGGLLDRFDSLILVAPAVFHYVNYFLGVGADRVPRILTGV